MYGDVHFKILHPFYFHNGHQRHFIYIKYHISNISAIWPIIKYETKLEVPIMHDYIMTHWEVELSSFKKGKMRTSPTLKTTTKQKQTKQLNIATLWTHHCIISNDSYMTDTTYSAD